MSAILFLDGVMIMISYRSSTITISLSQSIWSQFAMQASTCYVPRNQEHISHKSSVIANFLLQFSNFRYLGNRGWSETNFTYTVKFADPKTPDWCKNQEHISYRSPVIANFVRICKISLLWQQGPKSILVCFLCPTVYNPLLAFR